jgi:hypothetical protein
VVPNKEKSAVLDDIGIVWPAQNAQFFGAKLPANIRMVAIVPSIWMNNF